MAMALGPSAPGSGLRSGRSVASLLLSGTGRPDGAGPSEGAPGQAPAGARLLSAWTAGSPMPRVRSLRPGSDHRTNPTSVLVRQHSLMLPGLYR